jgi:hypothetical protein
MSNIETIKDAATARSKMTMARALFHCLIGQQMLPN